MKNIKYQMSVDAEGLVEYLNALIEAVNSGYLPVKGLDNEFSLHPKGLIDLNIKIRRKKKRGLIALEMAWSEEGESEPSMVDEQEQPA